MSIGCICGMWCQIWLISSCSPLLLFSPFLLSCFACVQQMTEGIWDGINYRVLVSTKKRKYWMKISYSSYHEPCDKVTTPWPPFTFWGTDSSNSNAMILTTAKISSTASLGFQWCALFCKEIFYTSKEGLVFGIMWLVSVMVYWCIWTGVSCISVVCIFAGHRWRACNLMQPK